MSLSKEGNKINRETLFSNENDEFAMKINTSGTSHIMNLLTNLYEDTVVATVREVVSNAIDAVTQNNKIGTVNITRPTDLHLEFKVTDTGIGMSYEDIRNVYSVYGSSTKGSDFDLIGAFGLGAKAPLAYCSEFVVRTVKDGLLNEILITKRDNGNYVEVINENVAVNEANGTSVTIPVAKGDVERFNQVIDEYDTLPHLDIEMTINNERIAEGQDYYLLTDDYDLGMGLKGKLWVKRDMIIKEMRTLSSRYGDRTPMFLLSGWKYSPARRTNSLILEIKPGLLNFSSSRDELVKDDKLTEFVSRIEKDNKRIIELMKAKVKTFSAKELMAVISELGEYSITEERTMKVEKWRTYEIMRAEEIPSSDEFNLLDIIHGKLDDKVVRYGMKQYREGHYGTFTTLPMQSEYNKTITNGIGVIKRRIGKDETFGINASLLSIISNSSHGTGMTLISDRIVISYGVNNDNINSTLTYRKYISEKFRDSYVIFAQGSKEEVEVKIIPLFREILNIEYVATDDLIEDGKSNRVKYTPRNQYEDTIEGLHFTYNSEVNKQEGVKVELTTDEIIEKGIDVVFSSQNMFFEVITGYINDYVENIEDLNVIITSSSCYEKTLALTTTKLYEANLGYISMELSENASYVKPRRKVISAAAKRLAETRVVSPSRLSNQNESERKQLELINELGRNHIRSFSSVVRYLDIDEDNKKVISSLGNEAVSETAINEGSLTENLKQALENISKNRAIHNAGNYSAVTEEMREAINEVMKKDFEVLEAYLNQKLG